MVQQLRLLAPNAGDIGSIPGQGTKMPHAPALSYSICLSLSDISLSIMSSKSIPVAANGMISSYVRLRYIPLYICTLSSFIHSFIC